MPDFDVVALDAIVTLEMMVIAIAEAEAEQEMGQAAEGNKALAGPVGTLTVEKTDEVEAPPVET